MSNSVTPPPARTAGDLVDNLHATIALAGSSTAQIQISFNTAGAPREILAFIDIPDRMIRDSHARAVAIFDAYGVTDPITYDYTEAAPPFCTVEAHVPALGVNLTLFCAPREAEAGQ